MFLYWVCDNIQILSQIKLISGDSEYWNKKGMTAWWVSLVCNLIEFIRRYIQAQAQLTYYKNFVKENPEKKEAFNDSFKKTKDEKREALLNIIKTVGDLTTATKGSGIADKIGLGFLNDFWCGLGGSISAIIFLYQTYK